MKLLFWKEWRENRNVLVAGGMLSVAMILTFRMYVAIDNARGGREQWDSSSSALLASACIMLTALFAGATLFAPEVGSGTLQFLTALPVSRARQWTVKVAAGLMLWVAGAVITVAASFVCVWIIVQLGTPPGNDIHHDDFGVFALEVFLFSICCYALGITVSPLFDRAVSATVAAIFVGACLAALCAIWPTMLFPAPAPAPVHDALIYAQFALWVVLGGYISYRIYTQGESLRSRKRFVVLAKSGIGLAAGIYAIVFGAYFWLVS